MDKYAKHVWVVFHFLFSKGSLSYFFLRSESPWKIITIHNLIMHGTYTLLLHPSILSDEPLLVLKGTLALVLHAEIILKR